MASSSEAVGSSDSRYLGLKDLEFSLNVIPEDLIRVDNYNETELKLTYSGLSDESKLLFQKIAVHFAIIGYGNKTFGSIKHNNKEVLILDVLKNLKINYTGVVNSKLKENEFTPRRMVRFQRYIIQRFIEKYNYPSYLWVKYADKSDKSKMKICFPGAEHFVTGSEAQFLLETYWKLDERNSTKIAERIERIFIARGVDFSK